MSAAPTSLRMVEVSGAEALWLLEGTSLGRLVYAQRNGTAVRPGRHVWEYGTLVVRAPAPAASVRATAAYHVDEIRAVPGTGWTVTVSGPAEAITDPDEAAHYRRSLSGWTHGPHDTLLRLHPQSVTGFRLARTEA
ncbi:MULTISPECIES: pyridoxamine 5'-phosphate oxidase family protein [unclassified Streptomyces]|uniref:pyridoxamine 5'-phosphate oxidase family protein n=1 Tax=unclassified Streptomyces TaxID=2593676 RepID=UPI001661B9C5|nr:MULTISPECIES: pyridoxamine 5'-phosphate oxidase family protein [unclassified Streptomyces]MBD0843822.1 pyridoxamine 5'-phosphate oxidase family protein [Streptomyces sp. TRM68416]